MTAWPLVTLVALALLLMLALVATLAWQLGRRQVQRSDHPSSQRRGLYPASDSPAPQATPLKADFRPEIRADSQPNAYPSARPDSRPYTRPYTRPEMAPEIRPEHCLRVLWADTPGSARLLLRVQEPGSGHTGPWQLMAAQPALPVNPGGTPAGAPLPAGPAGGPLRRPFIDPMRDPRTDPLRGVPSSVREAVQQLQRPRPDGLQTLQVQGWTLALLGLPDAQLLALRAPMPTAATQAPSEAAALSLTVSHDLRAPVRVVDGFARILKEDYGRSLDRIGNDHLDRILAAAARMNAMIDAMLSLAQLSSQPLRQESVNLSQLAAQSVEALRRAEPQRQVEVHIAPGLIVQGDPTLLHQVMDNLLSNAWKYTARSDPAQISFTATTGGAQRVFEVRDNGAGFDMRTAGRLFGLFQRLHSARDFPGTGLGLASVQRIVRRHGGEVWAESQPGQGARFQFTLAD